MSYWSLYFLAKVGLYYTGYIGLHWVPNLLFALALLVPVRSARWRIARQVVAWPVGAALLYYDSYLPTLERVFSQMHGLAGFSLDYMGELLGRVFDWRIVLGALVVAAVYALLARRIRFATFALGGIVSVPLVAALNAPPGMAPGMQAAAPAVDGQAQAAAVPQDPNAQLQAFYASEAQRRVHFSMGGAAPAFDIIVLHVCSLSWDDLDYVGLRDHPLFKRFDAVFTQFNSAASYSGPAALRVLRGNCGQAPHGAYYKASDPDCYVFPSLERLGYRTAGLLNHDGAFDDFLQMVESNGGLAGKMVPDDGAPVAMNSFDGSPIYADEPLLTRWWRQRQTQGAQPVALFYNTISLHDGNRVPGMKSRSSQDTYKPRLQRLLDDFDKFIAELEKTGRPVVVMLIPEHGAALRGDKFQISGMREIPNPRITLVPAAMKIVGAHQPSGGPVVVDKPVSYFGLYALLNGMLQDSPFASGARPLAQRLGDVQTTPFESENADVVVMRDAAGQYRMRTGNGAWVPYTP